MRYLLWLVPAIILSSCIPPRPKTTLCFIDVAGKDARCSDGETVHHASLESMDRWVCVSPEGYAAGEAWVDDLIRAAESCGK